MPGIARSILTLAVVVLVGGVVGLGVKAGDDDIDGEPSAGSTNPVVQTPTDAAPATTEPAVTSETPDPAPTSSEDPGTDGEPSTDGEPASEPEDMPNTGGGAAAVGLALVGTGYWLHRRRSA